MIKKAIGSKIYHGACRHLPPPDAIITAHYPRDEVIMTRLSAVELSNLCYIRWKLCFYHNSLFTLIPYEAPDYEISAPCYYLTHLKPVAQVDDDVYRFVDRYKSSYHLVMKSTMAFLTYGHCYAMIAKKLFDCAYPHIVDVLCDTSEESKRI